MLILRFFRHLGTEKLALIFSHRNVFYLCQAICKTAIQSVEPIIAEVAAKYKIKSVKFETFTLGSLPPTLHGQCFIFFKFCFSCKTNCRLLFLFKLDISLKNKFDFELILAN